MEIASPRSSVSSDQNASKTKSLQGNSFTKRVSIADEKSTIVHLVYNKSLQDMVDPKVLCTSDLTVRANSKETIHSEFTINNTNDCKTVFVKYLPEIQSLEIDSKLDSLETQSIRSDQIELHVVLKEILHGIVSAVSGKMVTAEPPPRPKSMIMPCFEFTCEFKRKERQITCSPFKDLEVLTEEFVDCIINEATAEVEKHLTKYTSNSGKKHMRLEMDDDVHPSIMKTAFSWPTIKQFNIALGLQKITEFVMACNAKERWLFGVYYLGTIREAVSAFYEYEVICGLPSPVYPIAQATASIYFVIEVSHVIPPTCSVTVTFQFETNKSVYNAEITGLSETALLHILNCKIKIYSSLEY
ncbi:uncharacterized protein [Diabrotica undecimpunctata]|uniref:uncharacterized protein n=1 Tax=Diabrotica undecimpunctata TaxID=50387 RepID=UPI003B63FECB